MKERRGRGNSSARPPKNSRQKCSGILDADLRSSRSLATHSQPENSSTASKKRRPPRSRHAAAKCRPTSDSASDGVVTEAKFLETFMASADAVLTIDNFHNFFGSLGVDLASVAPFVLLFKLDVSGCWSATSKEVNSGFAKHRVDVTAPSVAEAAQRWTAQLATNLEEFARFHEFVFKFIRPSTSAKSIAMEELKEPGNACWGVYGGYTFPPGELMDFLLKRNKPMTLDLWKFTLRFCTSIHATLSNYREDDVWPAIIDEFVEECRSKA